MAGIFGGGGSGGPDYVQPDKPTNPESPERWFDTDADPDGDGTAEGQIKVYGTDGEWHAVNIEDHSKLAGVLEDSHHTYPIPTGGIVDGAVTAAKAAFDFVTPTEFNNHTSDTSNPHNVDDSQTGAATALNNHASNGSAHHSKPSFNIESGTFNVSNGSSTGSVSYSQTYDLALPAVYSQDDSFNLDVYNVSGSGFDWQADGGSGGSGRYHVLGVNL